MSIRNYDSYVGVMELEDMPELESGAVRYKGSSPFTHTNVIILTAKNRINEEYYGRLQTLMIYKGVNSIMTLNSKVAEWQTLEVNR